MKLGLWSWSSFRSEAGVDLASDVGGGVCRCGAEVDVGEAGVVECAVEECVAVAAILAVVCGIVEFDGGEDAGCLDFAEDEVDMFLGDAPEGGFSVDGIFNSEKVGHAHFCHDGVAGSDCYQ